jgi:hypothetical protein
MLVLRILGLLVALTIAVSAGVYFVTGDRRYLRFAWQVFKYAVFLALLFLAVLFLERVVAIV